MRRLITPQQRLLSRILYTVALGPICMQCSTSRDSFATESGICWSVTQEDDLCIVRTERQNQSRGKNLLACERSKKSNELKDRGPQRAGEVMSCMSSREYVIQLACNCSFGLIINALGTWRQPSRARQNMASRTADFPRERNIDHEEISFSKGKRD